MTKINNYEKTLLKAKIQKLILPEIFDQIDFDNEIDSTLTYSENEAYFLEHHLVSVKSLKEEIEVNEEIQRLAKKKLSNNWLSKVNELTSILVYGRLGTGKTAKLYMIADAILPFKNCYFFRHPKPEIIEERGYSTILDVSELLDMQDCAVIIDEPQLFFKNKKGEQALIGLMVFARQRNITLVMATSDTRFYTAAIEDYADAIVIGDVEVKTMKRGSLAKWAIKDAIPVFADVNDFRIKLDEYIFYSRKLLGFNGLIKYSLPTGWNDAHSRPYRLEKQEVEVENELLPSK